MRKEIPIYFVLVSGIVMIIQYFIPSQLSDDLFTYANDWVIVIGIFALALGIWSLLKSEFKKLKNPKETFYASVLLIGYFVMVFTGLKRENLEYGSLFMTIFNYVLVPIQATLFSLLAFYIASAAYRAFRARTVLATILLLTAFIIMLRLIPLGAFSVLNQTAVSWILMVPNMAAKRAITIGVGLGAIATCIKIILGIERTYLGHD
jgi:FlaA1/EpsC-like NDP-sugar epimerase